MWLYSWARQVLSPSYRSQSRSLLRNGKGTRVRNRPPHSRRRAQCATEPKGFGAENLHRNLMHVKGLGYSGRHAGVKPLAEHPTSREYYVARPGAAAVGKITDHPPFSC